MGEWLGALLLHGLGHGGALGALIWAHPGNGHRQLAGGSILAVTTVASIFWVLSLMGFVAAALSF